MKKVPYKRKPGDLEIRILKNGKVIMVAPNEGLVEIAQTIDPDHCAVGNKPEIKENARRQKYQAK